ncbi:unnamed protein product [Symbiodinium natans]|uniref:SAM domain-containing protein n=1 Tax=Symbiodinium natans TaxID=878477 RepID=A0A812I950_9DINO|nr:unnamed protein product [Symbiodinium natans]
MASHGNDSEAEEFLWSLGVGASLPPWLQDLRHKQRHQGLNQGLVCPVSGSRSEERPGIGPQRESTLRRTGPSRLTCDDKDTSDVQEVSDPARTATSPRRVHAAAESSSLKDWLLSLDHSGFLVQYHDNIASKLDSVTQVVATYMKDSGEVDSQFFEDAGVTKLGHRRLFQKWFRENRLAQGFLSGPHYSTLRISVRTCHCWNAGLA